jgi:cytochrome c-type biogenesis protein CcmH
MAGKVIVTREDMLNVAKEIHAPGCTDSRTADYCQLSTAYDVRAEIWGLLEKGMNKEQVINTLVQKYGDRILASPPTEGFNLVAWILPWLGVLVGSILVGYLVYRWVKAKSIEPLKEEIHSSVSDSEALKIQEELKNWL